MAALADVPQPEPGASGSDQHDQQDPADYRAELSPEDVVEDDLVGEPGVADADERPAEDDDPHSFQDQQPAESDDERRHPQPGHERSLNGAPDRAGEQRHYDRRPPRPVRAARLHKLGDHDAAKHHDQANRQVDLRQEQREDLGHRQHHVHGALLEEVDQVLRRQELRVRDLEADGDHHDGHDHGQDTAVAAADPEPPGPGVLAKRLGDELGRDVGRGDIRGGGQVTAISTSASVLGTSSESVVTGMSDTGHAPAPRRDSTSTSTAARSTPPGTMYSSGVASSPKLRRDTP